ncbi:MAG: trigger factor [Anaerovoracaceae bacterium]|jgi:trigger factor
MTNDKENFEGNMENQEELKKEGPAADAEDATVDSENEEKDVTAEEPKAEETADAQEKPETAKDADVSDEPKAEEVADAAEESEAEEAGNASDEAKSEEPSAASGESKAEKAADSSKEANAKAAASAPKKGKDANGKGSKKSQKKAAPKAAVPAERNSGNKAKHHAAKKNADKEKNPTRKKKKQHKKPSHKIIAITCAIIAALIVLFLLLAFVFDAFGFITDKYRLNYDKYIKLGTYKNLEYTVVSTKVTKSDIENQINQNLAAKATTKEVKSGTVKKGDVIIIDYTGRINGKKFSGGSSTNYSLNVGSGSMIDGFESGLIGEKVGSTVKLHLKFPKNYSDEDVAGKKVVFTVKIKSKQVTKTPKYTVSFVKKNSKYDTKKEYEASIKKDLQKTKKENAESQEKNEILSQILENTKVKKYPEKQLKYEKEQIVSMNKKVAKQQYNMSWKKYLQANGMTQKKFNKWANSAAKQTVKIKLVTYSIAKKEDIKLYTDKEYKNYLNKLLKQAGFTEKSFKSQYNESIEDYGKEQGIRFTLDENRVMNKVMKYSKAKKSSSSSKSSSSKSSSSN